MNEANSHKGKQRRARKQKFFKLVRRVHLYLGLLMWPWVLIYGVSGFLFNHPSIGAGAQLTQISKKQLAQSPLIDWPAPEALAAEVVKALNDASKEPDKIPLTLVQAEPAKYSGALIVDLSEDERSHRLRVFRDSQSALLVSQARAQKQKQAGFVRGAKLKVGAELKKQVPEASQALLKELKIETKSARLRRLPELSFQVQRGSELWNLRYRLDRGRVDARKADEAQGFSSVRFIKRLHLTHTYTQPSLTRTAWAIVVDIMSLSMVLWALSGLIMWLQMKNLRRVGLALVALSVLAGGASVYAMYCLLS